MSPTGHAGAIGNIDLKYKWLATASTDHSPKHESEPVATYSRRRLPVLAVVLRRLANFGHAASQRENLRETVCSRLADH